MAADGENIQVVFSTWWKIDEENWRGRDRDDESFEELRNMSSLFMESFDWRQQPPTKRFAAEEDSRGMQGRGNVFKTFKKHSLIQRKIAQTQNNNSSVLEKFSFEKVTRIILIMKDFLIKSNLKFSQRARGGWWVKCLRFTVWKVENFKWFQKEKER